MRSRGKSCHYSGSSGGQDTEGSNAEMKENDTEDSIAVEEGQLSFFDKDDYKSRVVALPIVLSPLSSKLSPSMVDRWNLLHSSNMSHLSLSTQSSI